MGMRAAQYQAPEHAGCGHVGAKPRASGNLVQAIGARRARADGFEFAFQGVFSRLKIHAFTLFLAADFLAFAGFLISFAVSRTARTILSYPVQRHRLPASQ